MLRPIGFQYVGVWISTGLSCVLLTIRTVRSIRLAADLPGGKCRVREGVSVPLYKVSFRASQRTKCASKRETTRLMSSGEENLFIVRVIFVLTNCREFSVIGYILLPLGLNGLNERYERIVTN